MLCIGMYCLWVSEFLIGLACRDCSAEKAYAAISLEREAFAHENDPSYIQRRPCCASFAFCGQYTEAEAALPAAAPQPHTVLSRP